MAILKYILLTIICFASVKSDFSWGKCPKVQYELNSFDLSRYLGRWYEIARAENVPFEKGDCNQAEYTLNDDGSIKVHNSEFLQGERHEAVARANTTNDPFRLQVIGKSFLAKYFPGDYRVINTDYENFALIFSCADYLVAKVEFVWILSRTPQLSEEQVDSLKIYITEKLGYPAERLRLTNQSGEFCGY